jgi:hypothetical protein
LAASLVVLKHFHLQDDGLALQEKDIEFFSSLMDDGDILFIYFLSFLYILSLINYLCLFIYLFENISRYI